MAPGKTRAWGARLEKALAVDVDADPDRLANVIAQRRARWLLKNMDQLFLDSALKGQ